MPPSSFEYSWFTGYLFLGSRRKVAFSVVKINTIFLGKKRKRIQNVLADLYRAAMRETLKSTGKLSSCLTNCEIRLGKLNALAFSF